MIGIVVTTYNRPESLSRSLPQIAALGAPVLVVDDGSDPGKMWLSMKKTNLDCSFGGKVSYLRMPQNRGLAAALNIGLSHFLADSRIEWISWLQDDVDVHPDLLREMVRVSGSCAGALFTGHDSADHPAHQEIAGIKLKKSCAGIHMHARRDFWAGIMPIPTFRLGAPKRVPGQVRGIGSNVDWWIVRDAPRSVRQSGSFVACLPGLVRTFLYRAEDSSWGNAPKCGEDPPLRAAC